MSGTSAATYRLIEPHSEMLPYAPYKKQKIMSGTSAAIYELFEPHSEMVRYPPNKTTKGYVRDICCYL